MVRIVSQRTFACLIFALLFFQASDAASPAVRRSHVLPSDILQGSTEEMSWGFICYDLRTGDPSACNIELTLESVTGILVQEDCDFEPDGSLKANTCAGGGHRNHQATRPRILHESVAQLAYPGDTNLAKFAVAGPTSLFGWSKVSYNTPENAGFYHWNSTIRSSSPLGTLIGIGAQPDGSIKAIGAVEVSHQGFKQLPDMSNLYVKARGGDSTHPDATAYSGTAVALEAIELIAEQYEIDTAGFLIRPNDMSLPLGGLFDNDANWQPPHRSHRNGKDVDVNRNDWDSIFNLIGPTRNCFNDIDFVEAVNKVLVPDKTQVILGNPVQTAVLCEVKALGRRHIDITGIIRSNQQSP